MARNKPLTAIEIKSLQPGFHADGGNLYLHVRKTGSRSWVFQYKRGCGKAARVTNIGLGSTSARKLADARIVAGKMRTALADGNDPASVLRARRGDDAKTFKAYAADAIAAKQIGWKSAKHGKQWTATLTQHAYPTIGNKRPRDITVADVQAVLNPMWASTTETASRLRQRIEAVLDFAAVIEEDKFRHNPARWKGNLDKLFTAPRKVRKPVHFAALQYEKVPELISNLRELETTSSLCLRWTILTAARSGEARGAQWSEIAEVNKVWAIPAARMKAARDHVVPLCDEALQILEVMKKRKIKNSDFIFSGARGGLLTDVSVNKTLHKFNPEVTVHGFRSSFRSWGAEATSFPSAALELALAHTDPNKVQAAYQRSDLLELRRDLMATWGHFLAAKDNVIRFAQAL